MKEDSLVEKFGARDQNPEKYPFRTPEEVAALATKNGMSVPEFMRLYLDNLYEAESKCWNTSTRFKAHIISLKRVDLEKKAASGKPLQCIKVIYKTGKEQTERDIELIGIVSQGNATYALAKKFQDCIGKEVFIYKAYQKNKYLVAIDVEAINDSIGEEK